MIVRTRACPAVSKRANSSRDFSQGHGGVGSSIASYRSQAARTAARSSRATLGDLAGLPLLKRAPCSHREQISTRGSDAALTAPICPQCGQTIRVSMNRDYRRSGRGARAARPSSTGPAACRCGGSAVGWRYVMPDGRKGATPTAMAALLHALFMTPVRYPPGPVSRRRSITGPSLY